MAELIISHAGAVLLGWWLCKWAHNMRKRRMYARAYGGRQKRFDRILRAESLLLHTATERAAEDALKDD